MGREQQLGKKKAREVRLCSRWKVGKMPVGWCDGVYLWVGWQSCRDHGTTFNSPTPLATASLTCCLSISISFGFSSQDDDARMKATDYKRKAATTSNIRRGKGHETCLSV
jgi:hypothetical protein